MRTDALAAAEGQDESVVAGHIILRHHGDAGIRRPRATAAQGDEGRGHVKTPAVAARAVVQSRQFILRRYPPVCIPARVKAFTEGLGSGPVKIGSVVFIRPHQTSAGIQNGPVVIRDKPAVPAGFLGRGRGSDTNENPQQNPCNQ